MKPDFKKLILAFNGISGISNILQFTQNQSDLIVLLRHIGAVVCS